jgi:hypothetical protein
MESVSGLCPTFAEVSPAEAGYDEAANTRMRLNSLVLITSRPSR